MPETLRSSSSRSQRIGLHWSWRLTQVLSLGLALAGPSLIARGAAAFEVRVAHAPDSSLRLVLDTIQGARKSLRINIYEFSNRAIAEAIIAKIQQGVSVQILQEGQPVGGVPSSAVRIQTEILEAMRRSNPEAGHSYLLMYHEQVSSRRFRFNHAKYILVDDTALFISSENFSSTGHPQPGSRGNRGWEALLQEPSLASEFAGIFARDTETSHGDVRDLLHGKEGFPLPLMAAPAEQDPSTQETRTAEDPASLAAPPVPSEPIRLQASAARRISSPETSLSGLLQLIQSSTSTLDIEQMTFASSWRLRNTGDPNADFGTSPLFDAVVSAARRGVKVRVLLNDPKSFDSQEQDSGGPRPHSSSGTPANVRTVELFTQIAKTEKLPLEARIANVKAMGVTYIHNKGALVDQDKTLISSINWNQNSITNNRETAVVLTSAPIRAHYGSLFGLDWQRSETSGAPRSERWTSGFSELQPGGGWFWDALGSLSPSFAR